MTLQELAVETAEKQAASDKQAFERALIKQICPRDDVLIKAAETIQRLGSAAQDCKSCARLTLCNAYQTENRFENCDYKWIYAEEVTG
jgi:hypothetical protein